MKRLAWCLIYGFAGLAQAAINDVTFHGTLVSPPACTISDGKTIEVEFRNVIIDNINGDNFRQMCLTPSHVTPMCATTPGR